MADGWLPGYDRGPRPNHDTRGGFGIEAWVIHIDVLKLLSLAREARANGLRWIPSRGM